MAPPFREASPARGRLKGKDPRGRMKWANGFEGKDSVRREMRKIETIIAPFQFGRLRRIVSETGGAEIASVQEVRSVGTSPIPRGLLGPEEDTGMRLKVELAVEDRHAEAASRAIERIALSPDEMDRVVSLYTLPCENGASRASKTTANAGPLDGSVLGVAPEGFIWRFGTGAGVGLYTVTVVARNQPMIFPFSVGVLSLNGFDIVNVRSYRQESETFALFTVRGLGGDQPDTARLRQAQTDLAKTLAGTMNLPAHFRQKILAARHAGEGQKPSALSALVNREAGQHAVSIDNNISRSYSVIEVTADDYPGILYTLTETILKCGLDIWDAKILTSFHRIHDLFYVREPGGDKVVEESRLASLKLRLNYVLSRKYLL